MCRALFKPQTETSFLLPRLTVSHALFIAHVSYFCYTGETGEGEGTGSARSRLMRAAPYPFTRENK